MGPAQPQDMMIGRTLRVMYLIFGLRGWLVLNLDVFAPKGRPPVSAEIAAHRATHLRAHGSTYPVMTALRAAGDGPGIPAAGETFPAPGRDS